MLYFKAANPLESSRVDDDSIITPKTDKINTISTVIITKEVQANSPSDKYLLTDEETKITSTRSTSFNQETIIINGYHHNHNNHLKNNPIPNDIHGLSSKRFTDLQL